MPDGLYYPHWAEKGHGKGWWGPQMAIADGRAYVITSRNITYAFDAATGEMVWARPTPSSTLRTVIDGVYLPSGSHLVGYDAATGKEIWAIRERLGVGTDIRAPLRWAHDGKNYVITGNRTGTIICADPKTGKELLRVTDSGDNSASLHLAGDYLLANTAAPRQPDEPRRPYQVGAYRLSLEGAEKIWELPGEQYPYNASNRPLMVHEGMVYHRPYGLHGRKPLEGPIVRIDTGETVARQTFPMARGFVYRLNDRLILQVDCSHEKTDLHMHQLDPKGVRQLGEIWPTDHSTTSGYWPVPMSHAVAHGRIVIRGTRGIFCYDLRKQE
jgi:outer membrane protein assembly factor BamB